MQEAVKRLELIAKNGAFQNYVYRFRQNERDDFPLLFVKGAELCEGMFSFYLKTAGVQIDDKNMVYDLDRNGTERKMLLYFCKESDKLPGACRLLAETILIYYDKISQEKQVSFSDIKAFADAVNYFCIWFERQTEHINAKVNPFNLMMMVDAPTIISLEGSQQTDEDSSDSLRLQENKKMRTEEILECLKACHGRLAYASSKFTDSDSYKLAERVKFFEEIEKQGNAEEENSEQKFVKSVIQILPADDAENLIKEQQERIIYYIGEDVWNKLLPLSKKLLVTSRINFQEQARFGNQITYSSLCNQMGNIFEIEMRYRLFEKFIEYQKKKYGKNYECYHTAVLYNDRAVLHVKKFSLGSVPYILGQRKSKGDTEEQFIQNKNVILGYAKEELFRKRYRDEEFQKLFKELSDISEHIRLTYRNPAAHVNRTISLETAVQCMDYFIREEKILCRVLEKFAF